MEIKERLLFYIKYKGITVSRFENLCGMSNGYVSSMRKSLGLKKLENVLNSFPDLNRDWLLYGDGSMLKPSPNPISHNIFGDHNVSNAGIISGSITGNIGSHIKAIENNQEIKILKSRIKHLEDEVKELKRDKSILQEHISLLQKQKH